MNELLSLFPVLFLVYFLQCFAAAPQGYVVFYLTPRLRGSLLRRAWEVGRSRHRLFLLNPFLPFTGAAYVPAVPFQAVCGPGGDLIDLQFPAAPPDFLPKLFSSDPPRRISARHNQVALDGQSFLTLRSAAAATNLAALLTQLQNSPPHRRLPVLRRELRKLFSTDLLNDRLDAYVDATASLHAACFMLFLFLFVLSPISIFYFGLHRIWPALLAYLVVSAVAILWLFRRASRRLDSSRPEGRTQQMVTIALSPFAAIRANDSLVAGLLSDFHPLAVAHRLLPAAPFLSFARAELAKAKFLHRDLLLSELITEFLLKHKINPDALLAPPAAEDSRCRTYCPVCLTQYVLESGACQDCGSPLHPLTASA